MTTSLFIALSIFAAIAAYTPGPNNTLLLSSGVNHGLRASLPMIAGVGIGFPFLIICVGLGLGKAFAAYPIILTAIKVAGTIYMLWLAFKIATEKPSSGSAIDAAKPLNFWQACAFQWVNPKAWIMGGYALSAFTLPEYFYTGIGAVTGVFMFMGFTSAATWALFGVGLQKLMQDQRWFRIINISLAILLVASLAPMLWH